MNQELEAIKDAMDKTTGGGRDHAGAVGLAEAYVHAHPEQFEQFKALSVPQLVEAVSTFRNAHMDDEQWAVEAYLLAKFEPQQIGGEYQATVRMPDL